MRLIRRRCPRAQSTGRLRSRRARAPRARAVGAGSHAHTRVAAAARTRVRARAAPAAQRRSYATAPTAPRPAPHAPSPPRAPARRTCCSSPPTTAACPDARLTPSASNIAQVRAATLCLVNRERAAHGERAAALEHRASTRAAQAHTESMAFGDYFEHVGPGGQTPLARMRAAGYIYSSRVGFEVGENIAWGTPLARHARARSSPPGWPPPGTARTSSTRASATPASASRRTPRARPRPARRHLHPGLRRHRRLALGPPRGLSVLAGKRVRVCSYRDVNTNAHAGSVQTLARSSVSASVSTGPRREYHRARGCGGEHSRGAR